MVNFLYLLMLTATLVSAQTSIYRGESPISNISPEEARSKAMQQARLNAIEQNCGVHLQSESMIKDFMLSGDFIRSLSYGQVIEEKIVKESVKIEQAAIDQPPHLTYQVEMQLAVLCEQGQPDPAFRLSLESAKKTFVSGEEMVLSVQSTQDCYLTLVNFASDNKVYILMPSALLKESFLPAQTKLEIPTEAQRSAGIHLSMAVLPGQSRSSEVILAVATKKKIDFLDEIKIEGGFGVLSSMTIAGTQLARWLSAIPANERAEAQIMLTIQAE